MKKIYSKIEDFLVNFSRVFWVIISLLSFIIAMIFLILAFNKYFISESGPKLQLPLWSEIRSSIFPPEIIEMETSKQDDLLPNVETNDDTLYSKEFLNLLETIYNNFEDYPDLIRADITKNSLTSYIDSYLNSILDTREFNKRDIILGLEELLNQAYINKDLLKVGNYDNRMELLENSINNYFKKLDSNIDKYLNEKYLLDAKIIANKAQSFIYFYIGVASIGSFVFLVLFIIIFRVENHLRKMSKEND